MGEIKLTKKQLEAVCDSGGELLVSAAAGSGKTKVLVERLMRHICREDDPRDVDEFLIITFTNAAAAEMRSKIIDELSDRLAKSPGDRHLKRQMTMVYRSNIMTIHSFCASVLREFSHLTEVSRDFRVAESAETDVILARVMDDVLERRYENIEGSNFEALVSVLAAGRDDRRMCEVILDMLTHVLSHPYPMLWMETILSRYDVKDAGIDVSETVWGKILLSGTYGEIRAAMREISDALNVILKSDILKKAYFEAFSHDLYIAERISEAVKKSWDDARAELYAAEHINLKSSRGFEDRELLEHLKKIRDDFKNTIKAQKVIFDGTSSELLSDMERMLPAVRELFDIVGEVLSAYRAAKRKRQIVDFSDLEHFMTELLLKDYDMSSGRFLKTELAERISARFHEIMIDEYQDTNQMQNLIISAVSQNRENVFLVGDIKQSIYRFRLSDPGIFLEKYRSFKDAENAVSGEARKIILSKNFRSRPQVLDFINYIFENLMSAEFGGMDYGPDEFLYKGAEYPESEDNFVELNIIDVKKDEPDEESAKKTETEADFVADRIKKLLDGKLEVFDNRTGLMRRASPGDIAVIMRSPKDKAGIYERALRFRGIPVRNDSGGGFWNSAEIMVMVELLAVIDNPMQDVALVSVLRSPLYGFSDDRLCRIKMRLLNGSFYEALCEMAADGEEDCANFLSELREYRLFSEEMGIYRLLRHIYAKTNATAFFGAMESGTERKDNLLLLYEYAESFEKTGYKGLFMLVKYLKKLMEDNDDSGIRRTDAVQDAVTIMSIHKSKGLEFPVVILCDLGKRFNRDDIKKTVLVHPELGVGFKYPDLERMIEYATLPRLAIAAKLYEETLYEELRVLYVAMTRAKEKLILVCAVKDAEKMTDRLRGGTPVPPHILARSASMAEWILCALRERPEMKNALINGKRECLKAGETLLDIRIISDEIISCVKEDSAGAKGEKDTVSTCKADAELVKKLIKDLEFEYPHKKLADIPSKLTATQLKGRYWDLEALEDAPGPIRESVFGAPSFIAGNELTGAEKGTALHLVMQHINFPKCGEVWSIKNEIEKIKNKELITEKQALCVDPYKIARFFKTELGKKIMLLDTVQREFKFSLLRPACEFYDTGGDTQSKIMLQGVIDCYFEENGELTVVDFKTDYVKSGEETEKAEFYRGQLDAYGAALSVITGKKIAKKVIYFFNTGYLMEL